MIVVKTKRHAVSVSHLSAQMHDGPLDRHFKAPFHLVLKKQNELHVHTIRADLTVAACGSIKLHCHYANGVILLVECDFCAV